MLKYAGYDIVFQEIPDEVTLALNLSGCPNGCPGCHSPHLQRDEGEALTPGALERLLERYGREITCVCFMGGDAAPGEVAALARHIARTTGGTIRTGWYSGRPALPPEPALRTGARPQGILGKTASWKTRTCCSAYGRSSRRSRPEGRSRKSI